MIFSNKFIYFNDNYSTFYDRIPAPMFRKTFVVEKPVASCSISIAGVSFYDLYINGKRITKGLLSPYVCTPSSLVYYDEYPLADHLLPGTNCIGVILGTGLQNDVGRWNWRFDRARYRGAVRFAAAIEILYQDGTREQIECDTSWKVHESPIIFDSILLGEHYDARREIPGWNLSDFDDSNWVAAQIAPRPIGEPTTTIAEPIITRYDLLPVSITETNQGYVYDFGENSSGNITLNIKNTFPGQQIKMIFGEIFQDGIFNDKNVICVDRGEHTHEEMHNMDCYICKGAEKETYTPTFSFHGFQYVLVDGVMKEQATKDLLTYHVMSSDLKMRTSLECSDPVVNHLQKIVLQSDYSNFYYFPMDCPHREKNGWTGDAALSAEQMVLNLSVDNSFTEWMKNIRKAQHEDGSIPGYVPCPGQNGWELSYGDFPAGPAWDKIITEIPYRLYQYRGNTSILQENATMIGKYLNYIAEARNEQGLMVRGFGDWVLSTIDPDDLHTASEEVVSNTCSAIDIAEKAYTIFTVLNMPERALFAKALADNMRSSFCKHLIDWNSCTVFGNNQSPQALGIYYGFFEGENKKKALEHLISYIQAKDEHMYVGVLGGRVIFHVLAENGYEELAYKMITRLDPPSYGLFYKIGSTTLWEGFIDETTFLPLPYSRNHHFWGDISSWFFKYLAGIQVNPNVTNFNYVEIRPCFISSLNHVKATEEHPAGEISVSWERQGETIVLSVKVPEALEGKLIAYKGYVFENGKNELPLKTGTYKLIMN